MPSSSRRAFWRFDDDDITDLIRAPAAEPAPSAKPEVHARVQKVDARRSARRDTPATTEIEAEPRRVAGTGA